MPCANVLIFAIKLTISMKIKTFAFNPFQENTYILYDETNDCVIIDPGCFNNQEENELSNFIEEYKLNPVRLLNTHCHIDHVLGNKFIEEKYGLKPEYSKNEIPVMEMAKQASMLYEIPYKESSVAENYIEENDVVEFGKTKLHLLSVPGHSPGHLVFINKEDKSIIGGDVLFYGSIGRTDLPLGNHEDLIRNIRSKIFVLHDDFVVYPGHGPTTTLGFEKQNNPFFT